MPWPARIRAPSVVSERVRPHPCPRLRVLILPSLPVRHYHRAPERWSLFDRSSGLGELALAGDHHVPDAEVVEVILDLRLAVAAVGGHGAELAAGALNDPRDRGRDWGASVGLPCSTLWSKTTPSSLSTTRACCRTRPAYPVDPWRLAGRPDRAGSPCESPRSVSHPTAAVGPEQRSAWSPRPAQSARRRLGSAGHVDVRPPDHVHP